MIPSAPPAGARLRQGPADWPGAQAVHLVGRQARTARDGTGRRRRTRNEARDQTRAVPAGTRRATSTPPPRTAATANSSPAHVASHPSTPTRRFTPPSSPLSTPPSQARLPRPHSRHLCSWDSSPPRPASRPTCCRGCACRPAGRWPISRRRLALRPPSFCAQRSACWPACARRVRSSLPHASRGRVSPRNGREAPLRILD